MIKFFRNIRKNLLNEGKTSRYLKYAIGEIILVVIGILIALQINNWNGKRKEQKLESRYIIELRSDLEQDSIAIEDMINLSNEQVRSKEFLLKFLADNTDYVLDGVNLDSYQRFEYVPEKASDSILQYFNNQWGSAYNFAANKTTFDEMTSTGNVGVISNRDLRRLILETYNSYELYKLNKEAIYKRQQEELWKLIFAKIPNLYHLKDSDIPKIFKDSEILNRFEGNFAISINNGLLELKATNKKLLDKLRLVQQKSAH